MRISKKAILEGLRALYPDAGPELHFRNPYETLVAVMLSAQCTDKQVNKVTPALFERYPTVRDMAAASVEDVYPMVKSCGFKTKAANIVSACRLIMQNHGGEVPGTMEALAQLWYRANGGYSGQDWRRRATSCWPTPSACPPSQWIRTCSACPTGWGWPTPRPSRRPSASCKRPFPKRTGWPRTTG